MKRTWSINDLGSESSFLTLEEVREKMIGLGCQRKYPIEDFEAVITCNEPNYLCEGENDINLSDMRVGDYAGLRDGIIGACLAGCILHLCLVRRHEADGDKEVFATFVLVPRYENACLKEKKWRWTWEVVESSCFTYDELDYMYHTLKGLNLFYF